MCQLAGSSRDVGHVPLERRVAPRSKREIEFVKDKCTALCANSQLHLLRLPLFTSAAADVVHGGGVAGFGVS